MSRTTALSVAAFGMAHIPVVIPFRVARECPARRAWHVVDVVMVDHVAGTFAPVVEESDKRQ